MRFGLSEETIQAINNVFKQYPKIKKVILYGSRAKGTHKPSSDIDLVIMTDNMEFEEYLQLQVQLDELMLPYAIDLSIFKDIEHVDLIDHIQRVGIIFYEQTQAKSIF